MSDWTYNTSETFTNLANDQLYGYYVRARDGSYNTSSWSSATTSTQDTTSPTLSVTVSNGTTYAQSRSATITITDTV